MQQVVTHTIPIPYYIPNDNTTYYWIRLFGWCEMRVAHTQYFFVGGGCEKHDF